MPNKANTAATKEIEKKRIPKVFPEDHVESNIRKCMPNTPSRAKQSSQLALLFVGKGHFRVSSLKQQPRWQWWAAGSFRQS